MTNILRFLRNRKIALLLIPIALLVLDMGTTATPALARSVVWSNFDVTLT